MLTLPHLQGYTSVSDLALCTAWLPVVRREVRMLTGEPTWLLCC